MEVNGQLHIIAVLHVGKVPLLCIG